MMFWPSEIPGPASTTVCSSYSPYDQSNILDHGPEKSKIHNIDREALGFSTLHTPFLKLLLINARSLPNKISALRTLAFPNQAFFHTYHFNMVLSSCI